MSKVLGVSTISNVFRKAVVVPHFSGAYNLFNQPFKKGNKFALKEKMTPEAHDRRMQGLFKTWAIRERKLDGEKFVAGRKIMRKRTRTRLKLHATRAKEHQEIQEVARQHATAAMGRLCDIIADPKTVPSVAVAAIQVVLDRAYGKASQTNINANLNADGKPSEISEAELRSRIEKTIKRVEDLTGGAPQAKPRTKRPVDLRKLDRDPDSTTQH